MRAGPPSIVLDSNIISDLLRAERNPDLAQAFAAVLRADARVLLCPVVYYEVRRGLEHRELPGKLAQLEAVASDLEWDDLHRGDWEAAAALYGQLCRRGRILEDRDILIAVYARRRGAAVVSHNVKHFAALGVEVVDWKRSG